MIRYKIKNDVDPKKLYDFGFVYRGNWARGRLYQKEIPSLKGRGEGLSVNFDLGAYISFKLPYMKIEYPDIKDFITDLLEADLVEIEQKIDFTPMQALWRIDHTVMMNQNTIKFNIDTPEDYKEGDHYDPLDTDCKSVEEFCDCYDIIHDDIQAHELLKKDYEFLGEHYRELLAYSNKHDKALEIFKNCFVGEHELIDNADTNNAFKSPYRLRIYMDGITFNEWILKNKEEYDLLKECLQNKE